MQQNPHLKTWARFAIRARELSGLSRTELGERAGVNRSTVWRWEHARSVPESPTVVIRVARAAGLDINKALEAAGMGPADLPGDHRAPAEMEAAWAVINKQVEALTPELRYLHERLLDEKAHPREREMIQRFLETLVDQVEKIRAVSEDRAS